MIALLIALVGQLAVIRLAIGSGLTVGEAIRHGARRAPAYLAATLMWVLPILVVAVLLAGSSGGQMQTMSPGPPWGCCCCAASRCGSRSAC